MSSLPPNQPREDFMRASAVNMAVAQPTKPKAVSKPANNANNNNNNNKAKAQMHRRSRTGLSSPLWPLIGQLIRRHHL